MNRTAYHVVKREEGWAVQNEKAQRASSICETQQEAFERAKELVTASGGGEVSIHSGGGKIRAKHTYDKRDPFPPNG